MTRHDSLDSRGFDLDIGLPDVGLDRAHYLMNVEAACRKGGYRGRGWASSVATFVAASYRAGQRPASGSMSNGEGKTGAYVFARKAVAARSVVQWVPPWRSTPGDAGKTSSKSWSKN